MLKDSDNLANYRKHNGLPNDRNVIYTSNRVTFYMQSRLSQQSTTSHRWTALERMVKSAKT